MTAPRNDSPACRGTQTTGSQKDLWQSPCTATLRNVPVTAMTGGWTHVLNARVFAEELRCPPDQTALRPRSRLLGAQRAPYGRHPTCSGRLTALLGDRPREMRPPQARFPYA